LSAIISRAYRRFYMDPARIYRMFRDFPAPLSSLFTHFYHNMPKIIPLKRDKPVA
jgi:hypothetical protein